MKRISIAAAAAMLAFTQNFASSPGQSFVVEKVRGQNRPECEIPVRAGALPRAPQPMTVTQRANAVKPPYKVPGVEPVKLPGGNTVLAGALVYSDLWGQTDASGNYVNPITAGFYTVEAREGGKISQLRLNQALVRMRAGVKVGTLYYGISTADQDERAFLTTYYTSSWSTRSQEEIDVVNVPTDLTYSTATGTVYGFFYNDEHQNYDRFCTYNLYDGEATDLYEVDRNGYAVAANDKGEIYGIMGATGWLIRLYPDRRSSPNGYGFEYIGKTGFSPGYVNSMAFDDATGKLYWCANGIDGYSALLEVDTATGAATTACSRHAAHQIEPHGDKEYERQEGPDYISELARLLELYFAGECSRFAPLVNLLAEFVGRRNVCFYICLDVLSGFIVCAEDHLGKRVGEKTFYQFLVRVDYDFRDTMVNLHIAFECGVVDLFGHGVIVEIEYACKKKNYNGVHPPKAETYGVFLFRFVRLTVI